MFSAVFANTINTHKEVIVIARLSNEEIRNMSINECKDYSNQHPAESGRISKQLAKSSVDCGKVYIKYASQNVFSPLPESVTVTI